MVDERTPRVFDDPNVVINTDQAAQVLGISKRTLQRMGENGPARTWVSAGRVGYRVADVLEFQRNAREYGPDLDVEDAVIKNCLIVRRQPGVQEVGTAALRAFGGVQWRIAVCGEPVPLALQLPAASAAASQTCKEILIYDMDGQAAQAPISIIPVEGEAIAGQSRAHITSAYGCLRLVPFVFAALEQMQDCWAVA